MKRISKPYPDPGFGAKIRAARLAKGYGLTQFAELMGTRKGMAWKWEAEFNFPAPETLKKLFAILDVQPSIDPQLFQCERCGKEFIPKTHTKGRFCSYACWNGASHRELPQQPCKHCGTIFQLKNDGQLFCTVACKNKSARVPRPNTHCLQCGTALSANLPPRSRYCSHSCAVKHVPRVHAEVWTRRTDPDGYVRLKVGNECPNAKKGWMQEHRYVMQEYLGRPLLPNETVHHKNGHRGDNQLENLELWWKPQKPGQRVSDLLEYAVKYFREDLLRMLNQPIEE